MSSSRRKSAGGQLRSSSFGKIGFSFSNCLGHPRANWLERNESSLKLETSFEITSVKSTSSGRSPGLLSGNDKTSDKNSKLQLKQNKEVFDSLRDQVAVIEGNIMIAEREVLQQDLKAFKMKKFELELSYIKKAHVR